MSHGWTLNLGCGSDTWGDARLDISLRTQTGRPTTPNIIGDATRLPFADKSFSEVRCYHVLEHIIDWCACLREIGRVSSGKVTLRFPVDDGYKRHMLASLVSLDVGGIRESYLTRKNRAHKWIMSPVPLRKELEKMGFAVEHRKNHLQLLPFLGSGRKSRFFKPILSKFNLALEWDIVAEKQK